MEELKPCPFCGSTDVALLVNATRRDGQLKPAFHCKKCGARGPVMSASYCKQTSKGPVNVTNEVQREIWNRRA